MAMEAFIGWLFLLIHVHHHLGRRGGGVSPLYLVESFEPFMLNFMEEGLCYNGF